MGELSNFFKNKKNLVNLLILGILILAIPFGLNLLKKQQIIKSRATGDPIIFVAAPPNVYQKPDGSWVTKVATVSMHITSPLGSPASTTVPTSTPSPTTTPTPTQTSDPFSGTYSGFTAYIINVNGITTSASSIALNTDGINSVVTTCPVSNGVMDGSK